MLYWLLGTFTFPALNVVLLWWLWLNAWTFHTMAWSAQMIACFATLGLLLAGESTALSHLRRRQSGATLSSGVSALALLVVTGLVWLVAAEIVHILVTASNIPSD